MRFRRVLFCAALLLGVSAVSRVHAESIWDRAKKAASEAAKAVQGKPSTTPPGTSNSSNPSPADPPVRPLANGEEAVVLETAQGNITMRLFPEQAPRVVGNFKRLVRTGFYDRTYFYNVSPVSAIYGGDTNTKNDDPKDDGEGPLGFVVRPEPGLPFRVGSVGAAPVGNGDTSPVGSRFMINDFAVWGAGTTTFGEVVSGMDVVRKIGNLTKDGTPYRNQGWNPGKRALIEKARIVNDTGIDDYIGTLDTIHVEQNELDVDSLVIKFLRTRGVDLAPMAASGYLQWNGSVTLTREFKETDDALRARIDRAQAEADSEIALALGSGVVLDVQVKHLEVKVDNRAGTVGLSFAHHPSCSVCGYAIVGMRTCCRDYNPNSYYDKDRTTFACGAEMVLSKDITSDDVRDLQAGWYQARVLFSLYPGKHMNCDGRSPAYRVEPSTDSYQTQLFVELEYGGASVTLSKGNRFAILR